MSNNTSTKTTKSGKATTDGGQRVFLRVDPDGTVETYELSENVWANCDYLNASVGGNIQLILEAAADWHGYINEMSKFRADLAYNPYATTLFQIGTGTDDYITGPIVYTGELRGGVDAGLTRQEARELTEFIYSMRDGEIPTIPQPTTTIPFSVQVIFCR